MSTVIPAEYLAYMKGMGMKSKSNGFSAIGIAVLITICVSAIPLLFNHNFYYEDDWQAGFLPNALEIARILKSGHFPLLTDRLWVGGMFLGEYQLAIFHPFSLLMYLIIDSFSELGIAAAVFTISHLAVLSAGSCALCLTLGCQRQPAIMAGVVIPTLSSVVYWGAKIWIMVVVGTAWMSVAFTILILAYQNQKWFPLAVIASALVFLAAYPTTNIVFLITVFIALSAIVYKTREWKKPLLVGSAACLGLLLAAPAMLPMLDMLKYSARNIDPDQWKTSIDMIPGIGVPSFMTIWKNFARNYYPMHNTPILYASWFIPLVLINASWKTLWEKNSLFQLLCGLCVFYMAVSMLPGVWIVRWSFRYLIFFHFFLLLLCAYIISHDADVLNKWRTRKSALAVLVPFYIALVYAQEIWLIHLVFFILIFLLILWHINRQSRQRTNTLVLVSGHAIIFIVMALIWPINDNGMPSEVYGSNRDGFVQKDARRFALYSDIFSTETEYWTKMAPGNRALYFYRESVNGYSPFFPTGFIEKYCFNFIGGVCPQVVDYLFATDKLTGLKHIDMLNISIVVAEKGKYSRNFASRSGAEWRLQQAGTATDVYVRKQDYINELMIQQPLQGEIVENTARKKVVNIHTVSNDQDMRYVILSRPWYPGWRAYFNGEEIRIDRIADVLMGTWLPANSTGKLVIEYWPMMLTVGLWISVIAFLLSTLASLAMWRKRA